MGQDDLTTWLKASAENKITTKNTWRATLIEHFSDVSQFEEQSGVNFQRAGSTLEGCIKVYSTRVDDVSENTAKLLGIFCKDEEPKRKAAKRKAELIEKNLANINIKETQVNSFYDPTFLSALASQDGRFLVDILAPSKDGFFLYETSYDGIITCDEKAELDFQTVPLCPSFQGIQAGEPESNKEAPVEAAPPAADIAPPLEPDGGLDFNGPEDMFTAEADKTEPAGGIQEQLVFQESPFGYFRGWAGPCNWKPVKAKKQTAQTKPREKFRINFTDEIDVAILYEKAETAMSKEQIIERRRRGNRLPEDFSYERKDLYRFITRETYFVPAAGKDGNIPGVFTGVNVSQGEGNCMDGLMEDGLLMSNGEMDNLEFEPAVDIGGLSHKVENSMVIEDGPLPDLRPPQVPKRVDINRLKGHVLSLIENKKETFSEICKEIPSFYTQGEAKNISSHLCLISLLHIANEKSLSLSLTERGLIIRK